MPAVTALSDTLSLSGKRILLRASLNVPVENGRVANAFRMHESLKTIELLASRGARVVVCAHIGRAHTDSLRPVFEAMKRETTLTLHFSDEVVGERASAASARLKDGEVLLLENVRREAGEERNDPVFAARLAALADIYVNDAFADSHRMHASIVGVPALLPHFAGPNFMQELAALEGALSPQSPSLAIIGGAKFVTKEPLLAALVSRYDRVFVGGALANDFLKARGLEVGKSLVSGNAVAAALLQNSKLILPGVVTVDGPNGRREAPVTDIAPEESVFDVAPASFEALAPFIYKARFILWNGPMGNFERGFSAGTEALVKLVAHASGQAVVGGGDTIAAIERLKFRPHFTHVSAAGGAMLEFIANGTLPGIEALR